MTYHYRKEVVPVPNKLYIGNLPFQLPEEELKTLFNSCGTVTSIHIPTDRESGKPRGFGFIEMETQEQATYAITQLNDAMIGGRSIRVNHAVEKNIPNKPYAKKLYTGLCNSCGSPDTLYGFKKGQGLCVSCITSLFKAARPYIKL